MSVTSGLSQYMENNILNWVRNVSFPVKPATVYLALFTTAPVNAVDSGATEVTIGSNNYARYAITCNGTTFAAPSGAAPATSASGADFLFNTPSGSWGTITGWALYDASSGGNMIAYGTTTSTAVGLNDVVKFSSGNCTLSVS